MASADHTLPFESNKVVDALAHLGGAANSPLISINTPPNSIFEDVIDMAKVY